MYKQGPKAIQKYVAAGLGVAALTVGGYYLCKKLSDHLLSREQRKKQSKIKCLTKIAATNRASHITGYLKFFDQIYKLLLKLEEGSSYSGIVQLNFTIKKQNDAIFLDYNGESIKEIIVNHVPLKSSKEFQEYWDGSFITIPEEFLVPGGNQIEIWFENKYCNDGEGLHSFVDTDKKQYIYSNLEPYWASRLFPCMDQPNLKGKYEVIVINPKQHVCIANETGFTLLVFKSMVFKAKIMEKYDGNIAVKEFGDTDINILDFLKQVDSANSNLWIFHPTKTISSYLFAVISGPFKEVKCQKTYNNIQMSCFCRESLFGQMKGCAEQLFTVTIEAMKFYEQLFQYPYPFSKYDSIFCPEFNCGAMENVGAVTFNDMYLFYGVVPLEKISRRAQTITHELAHMWFGNLVTMEWWEDLWLNESFADFVALYCLREISSTFSFKLSDFGVMSNMRKIWGYREDGKISTHPIAAEVNNTDEATSIFDGITYSKGQAVVRQLLNLLGQKNFSQGLSEYFKKYEYKNATFKDFLNSLQKHFQLKEDPQYTLEIWANEWLKTASYNELTPVWNSVNYSENAELEIVQDCVQENYSTLRHHKIKVAFFGENCTLLDVKSVFIKAEKSTKITYDGSKKVHAVLLNYEDDCFVKVSLDDISLDFFKNNLHKLSDILSRNLVWRALYDMVHDGKIASAELIQIAVEQVPKETKSELLSLIFMFCKLSVKMYTPIKAKPELKKKLFQMILNQLDNKTIDNLKRMTFLDELVTNAVGHEELSFMIKFVDSVHPNEDEIVLTLGQKWTIVEALAKSQDFERKFKEDMLEIVGKQDQSSAGKLCLETCQTAIHQTESEKDKIWKEILDEKTNRSLFQLNAIMAGFNLEQTWETSRKFHDLFFENLIEVFKSKQLSFAQNYFGILFPETEDYAYLIAKTDEVMMKVPKSMQTLSKLLEGVKDEINVKMRAVEAYSKFLATEN